MDFLSEAFKGLQQLNEETFDISINGENDELKDFLDTDDEMDVLTIIDDEAEDEEELQDSYIGKVILDCNVCHSLIYKDAEEVHLDEEGKNANIDEECPFCYSVDGFKIIGQVKPFGEEEVEDKEEVETDGDEIEVKDEEKVKEESLFRARRRALHERMCRRHRKKVNELFDINAGADISIPINAQDQTIGVGLGGGTGISAAGGGAIPGIGDLGEDVDEGPRRAKKSANGAVVQRRTAKKCVGKECEEGIGGALLAGAALGAGAGMLAGKLTDGLENPDKKVRRTANSIRRRNDRDAEEISESIENLSLETEDTRLSMQADENGKVTVTTEPKNEEIEDEVIPNETIGDLDVEVEDEIETNSEEGEEDEFDTEEPSEDEIDIDEFDEETFESLGEAYLKKVYSNVESFKVSNVKESNSDRLFVEGLIKFTSGNTKKTNFVFKNCGVTKTGKTMFEGYNKEITRANKSFKLKGRVEGSKIISESLAYRYNQNKKRINGIVK